MINTNKDKRLTAKRIAAIKKGIERAKKNARRQRNERLTKFPEFWEQVQRDYEWELKTLQDENNIRR